MYNIAIDILKIINSNKYEAYIVGGFVRNLYLNKTSDDIDICTNAKYDDLKLIFDDIENKGFGSYLLKYNNFIFEITTYRRELEYMNNRYPKVEFINDVKEDLKRRDFTINTLMIDKDGKFIDLMNAKDDIENKIIKCVGNTDIKIKEDSLRIIRALRFSSDLDFKLDDELIFSIEKYKSNLKNISSKRIEKEINKVKEIDKFNNLISYFKINNYLKK